MRRFTGFREARSNSGETAAEAINRELIEEFELRADIGPLACLNESIAQYDGYPEGILDFLTEKVAGAVAHLVVRKNYDE